MYRVDFMAGLVQEHILGKSCRQIIAALHGGLRRQRDRPERTLRRRARGARNPAVSENRQQEQQPEQPDLLHHAPFFTALLPVTPSPHPGIRALSVLTDPDRACDA